MSTQRPSRSTPHNQRLKPDRQGNYRYPLAEIAEVLPVMVKRYLIKVNKICKYNATLVNGQPSCPIKSPRL